MEDTLERSTPPLQDLEHALAPLVTFLVLPVFALANAGVTLGGGLGQAVTSPVGLGIVLGLFVGKQVGITAFSWIAVRLKLADLPSGVGWGQLHAVSILGGIGFTMSLFVSGLAFSSVTLGDTSKIAILTASMVSGVAGWLLLRFTRKGSKGGTHG
jgi:NhaA family Na+:H+ antiporter